MELNATIEVNSSTNSDEVSKTHYEDLFRQKTGKDFNTFYNKYYTKLVWKITQMNINTLDAEDIANRAFMQSLNKIEMYNPEYNYSTWLFDIAKKMAFQFKKDESRMIMVEMSNDDSDGEDGFDPVHGYITHKIADDYTKNVSYEKIMQLKYKETLKAISKLDSKYRKIIELSDIQGKSYNEICDILGDELGTTAKQRLQTVKNRLHHGRIKVEAATEKKFRQIIANC
jgi:RNA polymerase sigma factor (sigma-70 family)